MSTQIYKASITASGDTAIEVLARISMLPKARLKDAMNKGGVWLKRGSKTRRVRRATLDLQGGDELTLYYNPEVLALLPPEPQLLADERQYSVWIKPAGLLAQGTQEGDHCSLLRVAELALGREVFLVHRLDREAAGLMLIAHTGSAAASLSALFAREGREGIRKIYHVEVKGRLPDTGEIALPLDDKAALTRFVRLEYDSAKDSSTAEVELITGRKHQIRRHFAESGHPVLGDPAYGRDNKDPRGLQLFAVKLEFACPLSQAKRNYYWSGHGDALNLAVDA